jgi:HSP20 family protein
MRPRDQQRPHSREAGAPVVGRRRSVAARQMRRAAPMRNVAQRRRSMRWRSIRLQYLGSQGAATVAAMWLEPVPLVAQPHFRPPADVYESEQALIVRAEIAGLRDGDFEVQLYEDALVIAGRRQSSLTDGRRLYEVGIRTGPFRLEVPLPRAVSASQVDASYDAGIVVVRLPWSVSA